MTTEELNTVLTVKALVSFILLGVFFGVVSAALNYHWKKYGIEGKQIKKIKRLYFGFALFMGIVMLLALIVILT